MKPLTQADIQSRIAFLETETARMEEELKLKISETYEHIKPINIIKRTIDRVSETPHLKQGLLNMALNAGLGFIGSKLMWGPSAGLARKAAGAALQLGVGNNLIKKATIWKNFVTGFFTKDKNARIHPN